ARRRFGPSPDRAQPADTGVAEPREDQLAGDTRSDHLIVDEVGRHPGEGQVASALADDLVARREADQVREALDRDRVPVPDELRDRVAHRRALVRAHFGSIANATGRRDPPNARWASGGTSRLTICDGQGRRPCPSDCVPPYPTFAQIAHA